MSVPLDSPTPYPDVNAIVLELLSRVQEILGKHLVGMYLDGSLAIGDFDHDSDIDFVVVTDEEISADRFTALQAMHDHLATMDSWWADQLEGSYVSTHALRRYDPANARHPRIERGKNERLKMAHHDESWTVHRYVLRERGITLVGLAPHTLIDPVSSNDLRLAMLPILRDWAAPMLTNPIPFNCRGYQSFTVLSLWRVLYTLEYGSVVSKRVAARWAQGTLGERWVPLIDRAWVGRQNPQLKPEQSDVNETMEFVRHILEYSQQLRGRTIV